MSEYRPWVDSSLRTELPRKSDDPRQKLHASLALLPVDATQVDYLFNRLLTATPSELPVLRDALKAHRSTLTPKLWTVLESAKLGDASLLPTVGALAVYDPDNAKWEEVADRVAHALVTINSIYLGPWLEALHPVRGKLAAPMVSIFRGKHSESDHTQATDILTVYATDDPNLIADLLMDSDPKAYASFFPLAQRHGAKTLPLFQAEIARKATTHEGDKDTEIVKDRLAERQARAAVALVRYGQGSRSRSPAAALFRSPTEKLHRQLALPARCRSEIDCRRTGPDRSESQAYARPGQQLMDAVLFHPETSMRRALILALGTYGTEGLSPGEREPLIGKLLDLYHNDPDSGIHGASAWTLRRWYQEEKLEEIDTELTKLNEWGDRRWYVNKQGQTFAVIEGPVEFLMGSPSSEPDRNASKEILHRRIIPRRFVIAAQEVSVEQYQRFMKQNPGVADIETDKYSPDRKGPMNGLSWYYAAAYCNWLSRQEGLPECYEPNQGGRYAAGMKIKPDSLRPGRLPLAHRGGMGVCLPGGSGNQPLLWFECGPAGAVWVFCFVVPGPRPALW